MIKKLAIFTSSIGFLSSASLAFAQNIEINTSGLPGYKNLSDFITAAIRLAFIIALIAVLIMLVWGAVQWIFSGGDKEAVAGARNRIIHALIGLAILAVTFAIVNFAGQFVGINILGPLPIPTPDRPAPIITGPSPTGKL